MSDYSVISRLNLTIDRLQTNQTNQHSMDTVYSEFCDTLKSEMNRLSNPKTVLLSSATQKKKKNALKNHGGTKFYLLYGMKCVQRNVNG